MSHRNTGLLAQPKELTAEEIARLERMKAEILAKSEESRAKTRAVLQEGVDYFAKTSQPLHLSTLQKPSTPGLGRK